ncbi:MAG: response regulator [Actinomycetota bacterium]|nr:response regulator [Actinomycetota bacterium]
MRTLVVDDDPDVRLVCRVALTSFGHEVLVARDGEEGLAAALQERPDVIVLDIMMPRKDGLSLLRDLRSDDSTRDLPVILLSALAASADQLRGYEAGADGYLTKPFSPDDLNGAIAHVASLSSEERAQHRREMLDTYRRWDPAAGVRA